MDIQLDSKSDDNLILPGYNPGQLIYSSASTQIYRAVREQDQQPVVLKVLKPNYPQPEELTRYKNEYEIIRRLNTTGVVIAYGLDAYRNTLILILEDCGGVSLNHWLKEWSQAGTTAFPLPQFLKLSRKIVEGIAQIHVAGIIHKNINPSNIVFNPNTETLKLIDFGLATTLSRESPTLKSPQILEGTLAYLSPEQTGRMNRSVDYRTDFYSLGVTFYELLTGRLPFEASDVMELVHCHLAKTPVAPHLLNPIISPVLSKIVLKLMAKAPEDRYQSAGGLQHDLDICGQHWQAYGSIPDFELGQQDRAERFLIPEKLYGRTEEIEILLAAFERVAQGQTELMMVTGSSGIGKTAVINEVHKPIVRQRGYFIQGKFDQFNHNIPFSALVQAFRDMMGQLLSESEAQRQQWQAKILNALGESGQVIIEVIPELERLIGPQPVVPELSGNAAYHRFNVMFQKFMAIFTAPEHPLVIFLDDLQWADWASLNLLELLMRETHVGYLLILGAYRENEVSSTHPLRLTIDEINKSGATISTLTLAPLKQNDINQLIADTLNATPELALTLTKLVYQKTKGNPFFSRQFLKALFEEGLITFDEEAGCWLCDLAQMNALSLTDDVTEFIAIQLQKLPSNTQEVLKLSACIGHQFDLEELAIVHQQSPNETAADLWPALKAGLVLPQSEVYKFFLEGGLTQTSNPFSDANVQIPVYRFSHDRVQQAAYSLIPEGQRQSTHLHIGQLLLKNTSEAEQEEKIFEIVNQCNRGIELLTDPASRSELAQLNLIAGQKAKVATAYRAAWDYFTAGRQLLPKDGWQNQYSFTLNLYEASVEAAYLNGHFEAMEELIGMVLQEAQTLLDTIKVYEVKIEALNAQNKFLEAVNTGLQVLALLGVEIPEKPDQADVEVALQETNKGYQEKEIAQLLNLPGMTDPVQLATMRILSSLLPSAFLSNITLYTLLVIKQVDLSIKYGNTPASAFGYASYGLVLSGAMVDIETGYQFGQLALDLVHQLDAKEWQCKVPSVVYSFIFHWKNSVKDTLLPLRLAYINGVEVGDFQFAGYSAFLYSAFAFFSGIGKELSELQRETISLSDSIYQMTQLTTHEYFKMLLQALYEMREGKTSSRYLKGKYYDEEIMTPHLEQANDWNGIYYILFHKLILNYLFGDYQQAVEDASRMEQYNENAKGFPYEPVFCLYDSLARLAANKDDPQELLARIDINQAKLKRWAQDAPMNCWHKFDLIEAERQRVFGEKEKAMDYYDRAIVGAQEHGYLRDEALANELTAKFYLNWGKEKIAQVYMQAAHSGYVRWGATAKAVQLEQQYARLLAPLTSPHTYPLKAAGRGEAVGLAENTPLDLVTVIKASQAITGEIELDRLLKQMMRIALENAGAQRGALILERDGDWVIEAQGDVDNEITVLQALDLRGSGTVSADIVYAVALSHNSIVLDDAAHTGGFIHDPYISKQGIKSVMCTPLVNQGRLSGMVYLENNLTTHAFTAERLELLNLLSTQMALSLDNARLYRQAQQEIDERKLAETALLESEQRFRAIFDSINDGILIQDLVTGDILDVNPTMGEMFGYECEEILRLKVEDLSSGNPPYTQADSMAWIMKAAEGEPQVFEWRAKDKSGRLFWVEVNMRKTHLGGHDRALLTIRDITDRKRIEEAIEKRIVALTQPLDTAGEIDFEDMLNLLDIQHLQDLFADAFGVAALITRPDGAPITKPSHFTDLCGGIIRKTTKGVKNCNHSDEMIGKHNTSGPNVRSCLSAGLCNAGVSITVGGRHIANWLIGQVRNENQDEEEIIKYAGEIGVDETEFRAAYRKVPIMSQEQFERIAQLLFVLANQVSTSAYQNIQQARFIAERKRAEEALEQANLVVENSPAVLFRWKPTTGWPVELVSRNVTQFGYTPEELLFGRVPFSQMVHPEDLERVAHEVQEFIEKGIDHFQQEYRIVTKDGKIRWVDDRTVVERDANGQILCYQGIVIDITERKQADEEIRTLNDELEQRVVERTTQLETAIKEMEAFSYSVSHDLRAPLRSMDGFSHILLEDYAPQLPPDAQRYLRLVRGSATQMGRLIDDLLAFSRLSRQPLNKQSVAMKDLVEQAIKNLGDEQKNREVKIEVGFLPEAMGDPAMLRQVWVNLLSNALKFTRNCDVAKIEIGSKEAKGEHVFYVKDNGAGFDMQYASKLFGVFQRLHTEKEFEGTGVGLAIVQRVIQRHGGRVWAEAQEDRGATFYFTLP